MCHTDSINIKILNAGAWARSSDRVTVTLPMELEDYIPQVEEFYRQKHNGRKLQWHHLMSNGIVRLLAALEVAYCHQNFLLTGILWLPKKGWGQQGQCFEFPTLFYTIIF